MKLLGNTLFLRHEHSLSLSQLGGSSYDQVLEKLLYKSTAVCPALNLDMCEVEKLRYIDGQAAGLTMGQGFCNPNFNQGCSNYGVINTCSGSHNIDIFDNYDELDTDYEMRACCTPGTPEPASASETCEADDEVAIIGIIMSISVAFIAVTFMYNKRRNEAFRRSKIAQAPQNTSPPKAAPQASAPVVQRIEQPQQQPLPVMQQHQQNYQQQQMQAQMAAQQQQYQNQMAAQQGQMMMQQQFQGQPGMQIQGMQQPGMQMQGMQQPGMQFSNPGMQQGQVQGYDLTGNGLVDAYGKPIDTTGDGRADHIAIDTNGDGFPDRLVKMS